MVQCGVFGLWICHTILLASIWGVAKGDDMDVLARTIWGEARGEGRQGMEAVASVIINRADWPGAGWWGNTVEEVCKKPYQFEVWNEGNPNRALMLAVTDKDPQFRTALEIARKAVARQLPDQTRGATHYYAYKKISPPSWTSGRTPTATIGGHRFYNIGPG